MPGKELCVVVPVYNEADNIRPVVSLLDTALVGLDWEAVFVDDDSPDGTAEAVRSLALENERVRLLLRIGERGLSNSCIDGLRSSGAEYLCVMDGDGQHDARVIRSLLEPLRNETADIVSAARQLDGQGTEALGGFRLILSRLGNALCRSMLRRATADPLTGFFAMRRSAFLRVMPRLGDSGFKLLFDILATGPALRHQEVPFVFRGRIGGESKLDASVIWQFIIHFLSRLTGSIVPPRLISFVAVGATGVAVHFAVLILVLALGASFPVGQSLAAISAMTSNFLLNNVITFHDHRLSGWGLLKGLLVFALISSVGLVANVSIATAMFKLLGGRITLAAIAGIVIDTLWKFVMSSRFVWRS